MSLGKRERETSEGTVDMTAMTDLIFVLLLFFVVSTTFVKDMKIDIDRPGAATQVLAAGKAVRVYIDKQGEVYMEGEPVRVWTLQSRIRDLLRGATSKSVLVVTDEQVPSGRLVEVVDQARMAGADDVGVATTAEAGEG